MFNWNSIHLTAALFLLRGRILGVLLNEQLKVPLEEQLEVQLDLFRLHTNYVSS